MTDTKELLKQHLAELQGREAAMKERTAPLYAKRDKLWEKSDAIRADIETVTEQIKAIEQPAEGETIFTLSREISTVAKALGGRSMDRPKAEAAQR
jgi:vacuolar-type H+-ATPase subunit E/Vma4